MPQAIFAPESTYGTAPSSGWRQLEVSTDGHQSRQDNLQHRGIRPAAGAPSLSGRRVVDRGGEATIEIPAFSNGLGPFFRSAASQSSSALLGGHSTVYEQTFEFGDAYAPANTSFTAEIMRERRDGTEDFWRYAGGHVTQVEVTQDAQGLLMFSFAVDYLSAERLVADPSRTPTVVDPDIIFAWADALITLTPLDGSSSGSQECLSTFGLTLPLGADTEDYCLKKGTTKHEPTRSGVPGPTGTATWRYQTPTYYDAFRAGEAFSLTALWEEGPALEASTTPGLLIEIPCLVFSGEDPQAGVDEPITQNLPFEILSNDTDPPVTFTFVTSDTAI